MKALSLQQPWATLVAIGAKRIETRSWRTHHRGPLAIHASVGFPAAARATCMRPAIAAALRDAGAWPPDGLVRGAVLAVARLVECVPIDAGATPPEPEGSFGDYTPGRWAWRLEDVRPLPSAVRARGALGLWEWPGTV